MKLLFHSLTQPNLYDVLIAVVLFSTACKGTSKITLMAALGLIFPTEQMPLKNCVSCPLDNGPIRHPWNYDSPLYSHHRLWSKAPLRPYGSVALPDGHFRLQTLLFYMTLSKKVFVKSHPQIFHLFGVGNFFHLVTGENLVLEAVV